MQSEFNLPPTFDPAAQQQWADPAAAQAPPAQPTMEFAAPPAMPPAAPAAPGHMPELPAAPPAAPPVDQAAPQWPVDPATGQQWTPPGEVA